MFCNVHLCPIFVLHLRKYKQIPKMQKKIKKEEWKPEAEAAEILGVAVRTLQQYKSRGKIPECAYTRPIAGRPEYHIPTLMGFSNQKVHPY